MTTNKKIIPSGLIIIIIIVLTYQHTNSIAESLMLRYYTLNQDTTLKKILYKSNFGITNNVKSSYLLRQSMRPEAVQLSSDILYNGKKSLKFSLDYKDWSNKSTAGKRAEIIPSKIKFINGKTYWVGFSTFFPSNFKYDYDNNYDVFWQFKGGVNDMGVGSPKISGRVKGDKIVIQCITEDDSDDNVKRSSLAILPLRKGVWLNWVLQVKFDSAKGIINIWIDDSQVVKYVGPNDFEDTLTSKGNYFKAGIYRPAWGFRPTKVSNRTIYYGNITIADSSAGYSDVRPK